MKLFFIKQNKFNQSKTWTETYQAREDKKLVLQAVLAPQEYVSESYRVYSNQPQVVYTRVDRGHNEEETQKIQQLYAELNDLPLVPAFA